MRTGCRDDIRFFDGATNRIHKGYKKEDAPRGHILSVIPLGFEPKTHSLEGCCSNPTELRNHQIGCKDSDFRRQNQIFTYISSNILQLVHLPVLWPFRVPWYLLLCYSIAYWPRRARCNHRRIRVQVWCILKHFG